MPSSKFDWQADEEEEWELLLPETEQEEPSGPRRLVWIAVLIIIVTSVIAVYLLLNRRVDDVVVEAEQAVLATHGLLLGAADSLDHELYLSLHSDVQRNWYAAQEDLLSLDLFWGRTALGLEPSGQALEDEENIAIELDPQLGRAIVSHIKPFEIVTSHGLTETVELERTFLYQRHDQSWQLSSLEDDVVYWGDWERAEGDSLTLIYPQRDESTARRLLPLLDELTSGLCAEPALECPRNFHLELKLDRDEQSLFRISDGHYLVNILVRSENGIGSLTLPAPSIIGRPLDEAGYQALSTGYASWLGAVIINNFAVEGGSADHEIIAELLAERGYQPPPWPRPMTPWPATTDLPVGVYTLPHDILMLCTGGNLQRLLRFETAAATWKNEWPFKTVRTPGAAADFPQPNLSRLPDYDGVLVTFAQEEDDQRWRTYAWRNGQEQFWLEYDQAANFWPQQYLFATRETDKVMNGFHLVYENNSVTIDPWWVDVEACRSGACQKMPADGIPLWSPDGQHTLLTAMAPYEQPILHLGDDMGNSLEILGEGYPISWVDDERFVYMRQRMQGVSDPTRRGIWGELVLSDVNDVTAAQVIIDGQGLKEGIAAERSRLRLGIVTALPYKDGWLVATRELGGAFDSGSYLFWYRPQVDELTLILENEMEMILPPLLLDIGGPYLAVSALRENEYLLRFLDLEDGQEVYRTNLFPMDWSADGQWLLFVENRQLLVAAPALDFEWTIDHNLPDCYTAVWNEPDG